MVFSKRGLNMLFMFSKKGCQKTQGAWTRMPTTPREARRHSWESLTQTPSPRITPRGREELQESGQAPSEQSPANDVFKRKMYTQEPYHRCRSTFRFLPQSQFQVSWNKKGGHSYPNTMSEFYHISSFTLQSHYFLFQQHNKRGADLIIL